MFLFADLIHSLGLDQVHTRGDAEDAYIQVDGHGGSEPPVTATFCQGRYLDGALFRLARQVLESKSDDLTVSAGNVAPMLLQNRCIGKKLRNIGGMATYIDLKGVIFKPHRASYTFALSRSVFPPVFQGHEANTSAGAVLIIDSFFMEFSFRICSLTCFSRIEFNQKQQTCQGNCKHEINLRENFSYSHFWIRRPK